MPGTKETNHINFCNITCTLSDDLDQPAHSEALSVYAKKQYIL